MKTAYGLFGVHLAAKDCPWLATIRRRTDTRSTRLAPQESRPQRAPESWHSPRCAVAWLWRAGAHEPHCDAAASLRAYHHSSCWRSGPCTKLNAREKRHRVGHKQPELMGCCAGFFALPQTPNFAVPKDRRQCAPALAKRNVWAKSRPGKGGGMGRVKLSLFIFYFTSWLSSLLRIASPRPIAARRSGPSSRRPLWSEREGRWKIKAACAIPQQRSQASQR